jgi:uncharacterized BrkB/YihY/UPF0761 family membrane protein
MRRNQLSDELLRLCRSCRGDAGALIVLLLWTYYSAQIFLFGAELTKSIADARAPDAGQPRETVARAA